MCIIGIFIIHHNVLFEAVQFSIVPIGIKPLHHFKHNSYKEFILPTIERQ